MEKVQRELEEVLSIIQNSYDGNAFQQKRAKRQAKKKMDQYRDQVAHLAEGARDSTQQWYDYTRDHADDWAETGRGYAHDLSVSAQDTADSVRSFWEDNSSHIYAVIIAFLGIKLVRNLRKITK